MPMQTRPNSSPGARRWRVLAAAVLAGGALFASLLTSRAARASASLRGDPARPAAPLVVVSGGYGSCKGADSFAESSEIMLLQKYVYPRLRAEYRRWHGEALESSKTFRAPRVLVTCFRGSGFDLRVIAAEPVWNLSFRNPRAVSSIPELVSLIRQQVDPDAPVYLVGHSWGGWLALQLASQLPRDVRVVHVASIDPISHITCNPFTLVLTIAKRLFKGTHGLPRECTVAPPDLSHAYGQIAQRTPSWSNFYQTEIEFLHSSPITQAHANRLVHPVLPYFANFDGPFLKYASAHVLLEVDQTVWREFAQILLKAARQENRVVSRERMPAGQSETAPVP